jgi:hypothetical protein
VLDSSLLNSDPMSGRVMPPKMPSRTLENGRSLSMMWRRTSTSRTCSDAISLPPGGAGLGVTGSAFTVQLRFFAPQIIAASL